MKILRLLALLSLLLSQATLLTVELEHANAATSPTVSILIRRIQKIDEIEGFLEDGADWSYQVAVWDGKTWVSSTPVDISDNNDDIVLTKIHTFSVETVYMIFMINLWERDLFGTENADISSRAGVQGFMGVYNLKTNSLMKEYTSGSVTIITDTVYLEEGYYKTSGDFDGSIRVDENDANLWFSVSDNYDPPQARGRALNPKVYTAEKMNFDASDSTASAGSTLVKFEWDFESDGIVDAEGQKTSFTYPKPATYTVTLKVTDSLGEASTTKFNVEVVNRPPEASFTYLPPEPSIRDEVKFTDTSRDLDGTITSWKWDFGDGTTSSDKDPAHKFTSKGAFTVKLTVTDNYGGTGSTSATIRIRNLPPNAAFEFTPTQVKEGEEIKFIDKSSDPEGKITAWLWDFGDGYTSSIQNPSHKFSKAGTYIVKLTVTDDEQAIGVATLSVTVEINRPPNVQFIITSSTMIEGYDVQFKDQSYDPDGTIVEWRWDFGDGGTSRQKDPVHKYEKAGQYTVTLTVTDNLGKSQTSTMTITIVQNQPPKAEFSITPASPRAGEDIQFKDQSSDPDGTVASWSWNFGDGTTSAQKDPVHKYEKAGQYTVSLTVTDNLGLAQTSTVSLKVEEPPLVPIPRVAETVAGIPTLPLAVIAVAVIIGAVVVAARKRGRQGGATKVKPSSPPPSSEAPDSQARAELERERIVNMLDDLEEKRRKGEIDEETYTRLKTKYKSQLDKLT